MTDKDLRKSRNARADEENLFIFCKQMIKTRVFQGCYQERRYVDSLKDYRDLVVLDNSETELKGDLKYIRSRIDNFYKNPDLWVGITLPEMIGAPAGVCIWTEVENTAFGKYWFHIKSIRFKSNEVLVKMKPIRPVSATNTIPTGEFDARNRESSSPDDPADVTSKNFINLLVEWKRAITNSLMTFLATDINRENIIAALRFTSLLFLSLMTGSLEVVKFLGAFSIRFFAEMRMLLHTATPIILKLIDLLSKIVGGFFILLAMIWRDAISPRRGQDSNTKRIAPPQNIYRALPDRAFYENRNRPFYD